MGCFIAIDVETANRHQGSICQIGLACFDDGALAWQWSALVDPEGAFDPFNVDIHGITPERIAGAAKWPAVVECIASSLSGQTIVSHTRFDQIALAAASERYRLPPLPECRWIDSHAIARQIWPEMGRHRLRDLCETLDIELNHHDALSDATACGRIILAGLRTSGLTLEQLIARQAPSRPWSRSRHRRTAGPRGERHQRDHTVAGVLGGPLQGQVVVFTGAFEGGKRPLSELAAAAGCDVDENFAKSRTTILVVGRRDPTDWGGIKKSGKHRRAEAALAEGHKIEIMSEDQFRDLLQRALSSAALKAAV